MPDILCPWCRARKQYPKKSPPTPRGGLSGWLSGLGQRALRSTPYRDGLPLCTELPTELLAAIQQIEEKALELESLDDHREGLIGGLSHRAGGSVTAPLQPHTKDRPANYRSRNLRCHRLVTS